MSNIARCSSKTIELRDIDSIGCRERNIAIWKLEIDIFKIKVVTFIIKFGRNYIKLILSNTCPTYTLSYTFETTSNSGPKPVLSHRYRLIHK